MKKFAPFLFLLACVWAGSEPSAFAESVTLKLSSAGSTVYQGVYVGPYTATVNGTDQTMQIVCDDYAHHVWIGREWTADIHTFDDLSGTRWGSGALLKYQQAAWLVKQMELYQGQVGDIHLALWNLFTTSAPDTVGSNEWLAKAPTDFSGFGNFFKHFIILTPTDRGSGSAQEFITTTPTPEPASLFLLGTGLAGGATYLRRRYRTNDSIKS